MNRQTQVAIYLFPPLFYLAVALLGRVFTAQGVDTWYPLLAKPAITPPGGLIGAVWTTIYILSSASMILFMKAARGTSRFWTGVFLYVLNGAVNALWSYIFFTAHMLGLAVIDAVFILITVVIVMVRVYPVSRAAALLLLPYALWVSFASYLTYSIYRLN